MTRTSVSAKALSRSYRSERIITVLIGLVLLIVGVAAFVIGLGWLGKFRSQRAVLDPIAMKWLSEYSTIARIAAILIGVALLVFGLWFFVRSLRTEKHPDLELDRTVGSELTVTSGAIANAIRHDAETISGVSKARARAVGTAQNPALRLTLSLADGADLKAVWHELDANVLERARLTLGVDTLPTAVRLELDSTKQRRVS